MDHNICPQDQHHECCGLICLVCILVGVRRKIFKGLSPM